MGSIYDLYTRVLNEDNKERVNYDLYCAIDAYLRHGDVTRDKAVLYCTSIIDDICDAYERELKQMERNYE